MCGMSKVLDIHIVRNKTQRFVEAYQSRIEKGYPRWLARLILSLQRKPFGLRKKERDLRRFIIENEEVFKSVL